MSIDDKLEQLYKENKLSEKRGNKPRQNELSFEGFTVESGEHIPANATQSEPMGFCPECNGMMLPYLDGHKCNDCGYVKGVSEELIKESEEKEKRYAFSSVEIKPKINNYKPRSRIIRPKEEVMSTLSSDELKDKLTNLNDDAFDFLILQLGVPKSLDKEEKIIFIMGNYRLVRIENAINYVEEKKL